MIKEENTNDVSGYTVKSVDYTNVDSLSILESLMAQSKKDTEEKKEKEEEKPKRFFFMDFKSNIDRIFYATASEEEKEKIRHQQMVERGFIEEVAETVEEVVETVKEVATRTVSRLRQRMNILKSMMRKKSYTLVKHDSKVSNNTPEFRYATELHVEESEKSVLTTDNAIFNRSVFPDTS